MLGKCANWNNNDISLAPRPREDKLRRERAIALKALAEVSAIASAPSTSSANRPSYQYLEALTSIRLKYIDLLLAAGQGAKIQYAAQKRRRLNRSLNNRNAPHQPKTESP